MSYEPTKEDVDFLNQVDKGYIGLTKPKIKREQVEYDRNSWRKYQASKELGVPENQLADEPDEMLDHSDQQGWD